MKRTLIVPLLIGAAILLNVSGRFGSSIAQDKPAIASQHTPVTFKDAIAPMLKEKCTPCHFKGGKIYDRFPFEQYETVRKLGPKLNTRLKAERAEMVTRWIEQGYPKE